MRMQPIAGSSMLATVGYNSEQEVMVVQFQNGSFYRYDGVPEENFVAVVTARESQGKAFNEFVKNRDFPFSKIDAEAVLAL